MPIDTQDKRSSAIGCRRLPWFRRFTFPVADGSINQADRQQFGFVYRGISAGLIFTTHGPAVFTAGQVYIQGVEAGQVILT